MIGKTLGHYEITDKLGQGGMGSVWLAQDSKLGRQVAIKTLPEEFAQDEERLARFEREAKLLASLNHPNIAAIYGLEEDTGTRFLVLELVEGDTLADRLKRGAVPVEESLKLALQIAKALEAAHEKGVIHRDLKPANIKVTSEERIKVLDFGLAKAFAGDGADASLSNSPTLSMAATQQGVILGTAAYMSPEQASGEATDKRADIWSFGVVLFELLVGRQVFTGRTASHVMGAVLNIEPDWNSLPPNLHPRLRLLLERCLEKEAKDRGHDIADVRVDIQKVLADPNGVMVQEAAEVRASRPPLSWVALTAVLSMALVGVTVWNMRPTAPPDAGPISRFDYQPPEGLQFGNPGGSLVAISPDGRHFAYNTAGGLYLRSMDELEARLLPETQAGVATPVFSPDSRWIAYWSQTDAQLKKIAVGGGAPVTLCDAVRPDGVSWTVDDTLLFGRRNQFSTEGAAIMRISSNGGTPEVLIEAREGELVYGPQLLPDGESVLFTVTRDTGPTRWDRAQVVVDSSESGERRVLFETGNDARYVPTGHLTYAIDNVLFAVRFDVVGLEVVGGSVPVIEGVGRGSYPGQARAAAHYGFSDSGTLVYLSGGGGSRDPNLLLVDREGIPVSVTDDRRDYDANRMSPDGQKIAVGVVSVGESDIWVYDLQSGTPSQLTETDGREKRFPTWSPDGSMVAFTADGDIYWKKADGSEEAELLWDGEYPIDDYMSFSSDGKYLALAERGENKSSIWVLSMENRTAEPFRNDPGSVYRPIFSPDGKWIAYDTNESGRAEVWVAPFPGPGSRIQVSTDGGAFPMWSPDLGALFFRGGPDSQEIWVARIKPEPSFSRNDPAVLFRLDFPFHVNDIDPDGERFLMLGLGDSAGQTGDTAAPRQDIIIVQNWFEELKERVPVP